MQYVSFGHVPPLAPLHFIGQYNQSRATWLCWSCDANGVSVSIIWCWWHPHWNHCISQVKTIKMRWNVTFWSNDAIGTSVTWFQIALSVGPFISYVMTIKLRYSMTSSLMSWHWCWHQYHMMLITSPVTSLYSLGQDEELEVKHNTIGHVISLALARASHDADGIVNSTIPSLRSR